MDAVDFILQVCLWASVVLMVEHVPSMDPRQRGFPSLRGTLFRLLGLGSHK